MFDRIRNAFARKPAHPLSLLPAAVVNEALHSALDAELIPKGFERAKPLKWVRSTKTPIREIVELYALNGASVAPRWGYSLDFVPHVAGGRVRWHRTAKASLLDLVWDPLDFAGLEGWTCSRFADSAELPMLTRAFAAKVSRAALADLGRANVVSDLPALYREWSARPTVRFSIRNYVQASLGEAFVLARLRLPGAIERLRDGAAQSQLDEAVLHQLLGLLAPTSDPD